MIAIANFFSLAGVECVWLLVCVRWHERHVPCALSTVFDRRWYKLRARPDYPLMSLHRHMRQLQAVERRWSFQTRRSPALQTELTLTRLTPVNTCARLDAGMRRPRLFCIVRGMTAWTSSVSKETLVFKRSGESVARLPISVWPRVLSVYIPPTCVLCRERLHAQHEVKKADRKIERHISTAFFTAFSIFGPLRQDLTSQPVSTTVLLSMTPACSGHVAAFVHA